MPDRETRTETGNAYHMKTDAQNETNRQKSKIRMRIEHVLGYMSQSMKCFHLRCIGRRRNAMAIGLITRNTPISLLEKPSACSKWRLNVWKLCRNVAKQSVDTSNTKMKRGLRHGDSAFCTGLSTALPGWF